MSAIGRECRGVWRARPPSYPPLGFLNCPSKHLMIRSKMLGCGGFLFLHSYTCCNLLLDCKRLQGDECGEGGGCARPTNQPPNPSLSLMHFRRDPLSPGRNACDGKDEGGWGSRARPTPPKETEARHDQREGTVAGLGRFPGERSVACSGGRGARAPTLHPPHSSYLSESC